MTTPEYEGLRDEADADKWVCELRETESDLTAPRDSDAEPTLGVVAHLAAAPAAADPELEPRMFSSRFWKSAAERCVKTFAQTMVAAMGVSSIGLVEINWQGLGALAASAALASMLTSLAGLSGPQSDAQADA